MMSRTANILVVEDDTAMRQSCAKLFRLEGYGVVEASSGADALDHIKEQGDIDIVLTDIKMPEMDGMTLLKEIKSLDSGIVVVLMTGYGSIKNAIEAMKHGAADYITKPFDTNELLMTISKIVRLNNLQDEVSRLQSELHDKYRFENIVGTSPNMILVYKKIEAARKADSTVLIYGESGTGKELVAKAIHYNGLRANKPFVPINCAAMPKELVESELFGHKKGAFTGALSDSAGLFRTADGGTIFLDEILDMPYESQAKLLRVLQEKQIRSVGDTKEVPVNVRVIASTNQDVDKAVSENKFRKDLYYRISVIRINLPSLRAHLDDIPLLVRHFIAKFNGIFQQTIKGIDTPALDTLIHYDWPGNVRELESTIENAFAFASSDMIHKSDLPAYITKCVAANKRKSPKAREGMGVSTLFEAEKKLLVQALKAANGNKTRAAQLLGISRPRLYKMMQRHEIRK
ncbi:MAG: sigma-54-dependent Fis family transcriptional regulator [Planctomycetes bacterium]|nr:sigma-54-dependent Fis family transcriptional regulator [Planctomycetota bacterium]